MDAEDGVAMGFGDKRFPRGTSGIASKNGRVIATSVTYCFKTGTRSSGPSSTIATVSEWLLRLGSVPAMLFYENSLGSIQALRHQLPKSRQPVR
jgi:hypothetical protein